MKIVSLKDLPETPTSHSGVGKKKVMVPSGQIPNIWQFSQVSFKPGEIAQEHKHDDMYEVMLVEKGSGIMKINGVEHALSDGVCVTIEPGELHEVISNGTEDLTLTFFGLFKS